MFLCVLCFGVFCLLSSVLLVVIVFCLCVVLAGFVSFRMFEMLCLVFFCSLFVFWFVHVCVCFCVLLLLMCCRLLVVIRVLVGCYVVLYVARLLALLYVFCVVNVFVSVFLVCLLLLAFFVCNVACYGCVCS